MRKALHETDLGIRLRRWLGAAVVLFAFDRGDVEATTTYSPPIRNATGDDLSCIAQNHTAADVEVTGTLRGPTGAVLNTFGIEVQPGRAVGLAFSDTPVSAGYCQFDFEGDDAAVRGYVTLTDDGLSSTRLLFGSSEVRGVARNGVVTTSPPVQSGSDDLVACVVQNVGNATVEVTAELRNAAGSVIDDITLDVGAGDVTTALSAVDPAGSSYCRFSFDGNPASLRGFLRLSDDMGGNTRFLAAASENAPPGAARLYAPSIIPSGGIVRCVAQNLSNANATVSADVISSDGTDLDPPAEATLAPGAVALLTSSSAIVGSVSCRFDLDSQPSGLRLFTALDFSGGTRILEPARAAGGPVGLGATSYSPSLNNHDGDDVECWVQNVGLSAVDVDTSIISSTGALVDDDSSTIAAGTAQRVLVSDQALLGLYCRFVFDGSPNDVRGYIVLDDGQPQLLHLASIALPLIQPTATRTRTATRTPTPTATPTSSRTPTATATATGTRTPTGTATGSATATLTRTATPSPTSTSTAAPSATATTAATPTLTTAATPTATATATPLSASPTATGGATTPSPTSEPSPTTAPGCPGDANCDGVISAPDLSTVAGAIASGAAAVCGEDADQSGGIDAGDLQRIVALIFSDAGC